MRDGRVQSFNVLQQRLNRKTVSDKLMSEFPAHLRAYDLLVDGEEDLRDSLTERRMRLERSGRARLNERRVDLPRWWRLRAGRSSRPHAQIRALPARAPTRKRWRASCSSDATRPIFPAEPGVLGGNGRTSLIIDAVLMYAQRVAASARPIIPTTRSGSGPRARMARSWCRWQGLFRLHRRGTHAHRPFRSPQHRRPLRPGA